MSDLFSNLLQIQWTLSVIGQDKTTTSHVDYFATHIHYNVT